MLKLHMATRYNMECVMYPQKRQADGYQLSLPHATKQKNYQTIAQQEALNTYASACITMFGQCRSQQFSFGGL